MGIRTKSTRWTVALGVLLALVWAHPRLAAQTASSKAAQAARRLIEGEGRAVMFVSLKLAPPAAAPSGLSPSSGPGLLQTHAIARAGSSLEAALQAIGGSTVRYRFSSIPCLVVEVRESLVLDFLESLETVESLELDREGRGALYESISYIRADKALELGFDGSGVTVAILDSGIAASHPAFRGAVIHEYHFLEQGADVGPGAVDEHGHGTNVAGILASRGAGAPLGVAPGVKIVAIRVLNRNNLGWLADWAAGVDWVIRLAERAEPIRADVINMSLVSNASYTGVCDDQVTAFARVCAAARARGIAIFAASGNDGLSEAMCIPACYSSVISVGSVPDSLPRRMSLFTNRNALLDLLAPGERITSTGLGGGTSTFAGTSQACPHAAGIACLLKQVEPSMSPERIRRLLVATGTSLTDTATNRVFPIVDARAALEAAIVPEISNLTCVGVGRVLEISWSPLSGVASYRLAIGSGGEKLFETELDGASSRYYWLSPHFGGYEVTLAPLDAAGLKGLEAGCLAWTASARPFVRSDCSADGKLDISDGISALRYLFLGESDPPCLEACDSNDDGRLDVADSIYTLSYLFLSGKPPPQPFGACGPDPEGYALGCSLYPCP